MKSYRGRNSDSNRWGIRMRERIQILGIPTWVGIGIELEAGMEFKLCLPARLGFESLNSSWASASSVCTKNLDAF